MDGGARDTVAACNAVIPPSLGLAILAEPPPGLFCISEGLSIFCLRVWGLQWNGRFAAAESLLSSTSCIHHRSLCNRLLHRECFSNQTQQMWWTGYYTGNVTWAGSVACCCTGSSDDCLNYWKACSSKLYISFEGSKLLTMFECFTNAKGMLVVVSSIWSRCLAEWVSLAAARSLASLSTVYMYNSTRTTLKWLNDLQGV